MPGGGKGPTQQGTITQTTTNPTAAAQLPYLDQGYQQASSLDVNNPLQYYPGQTLAIDPSLESGYGNLLGASGQLPQLSGAGNTNFLSSQTGGMGVGASPAFGSLASLIASGNPANPYLPAITNVGNQAELSGQSFGGAIAGIGNNMPGAVTTDVSGMTGLAGALPGQLAPAESSLSNNAATAIAGNPALAPLYAAASGAFLGSNPYLAGEYGAAAQPVVNAYQTATAPQTDSNLEAAGRYGSGALQNAQSINEQNLGTTLGNLGANLYGQDYANERGLMTQAGEALGGQYLTGNAQSTAADQALASSILGGASTAGSLYGQAANTSLSALQDQAAAEEAAAAAQNAGYNTALNAFGTGGGLSVSGLSPELSALGTLQGGYQAGNTASLLGLGMEPQVESANLAGPNAQIAGGQGMTTLEQQQLQDAMNRFYGTQGAPWQTAQQFMSLLGSPVGGSNTQTSPLLGPSALSSILGTGLGGLALANGLNTATGTNGAFGSNGLFSGLGSLFGGGSAAAGGAADATAAAGATGSSASDALLLALGLA